MAPLLRRHGLTGSVTTLREPAGRSGRVARGVADLVTAVGGEQLSLL